jgi:hypothetical protein
MADTVEPKPVHIVSIVIEKFDDNPDEKLMAYVTFGFCDGVSRFDMYLTLDLIDAWLSSIKGTKVEHLIGRHLTANKTRNSIEVVGIR